MALLANSITTEVILLLIGLYLFDGGIVRKFGAVALFITDLSMTLSSQNYISDLSSTPTNQGLFFTPAITNAWATMLSILIVITLLWTFISFARIMMWLRKPENKMTWTLVMEEFV